MKTKSSSNNNSEADGGSADGALRKHKLVELLNEAETASAPLQNVAQEVVDLARHQRDLAFALKQVVVEAPPDIFATDPWVRVAEAWKQQNHESRSAVHELSAAYGALVVNVTTTGTSTSTAVVSTMLMPTDAIGQLQRGDAINKVDAVLRRSVSIDRLRTQLVALRLDKQRGEFRSGLDLLNDGYVNLRRPSSEEPSPSSVLIPLRQTILTVVDELLKRTPPPQETSKGIDGKIMLLGRRCARAGYSRVFFANLGANARYTIDHLSSAGKDRVLTRAELTILFDSGLLIVNSLLRSMDPRKLRTP